MGNVEGLCWICRLRLWLASFQHQSQELWEQRQMVTSVSRLQGCCMNGSPKPWPGCRALLPNVTCHSSPADVSVSHESSISHWTWVIDRKEIHHGVSEAYLSVLGTRMVPFTSLIPSPKISLQLPPFLPWHFQNLSPPHISTILVRSPHGSPWFFLALPAIPTSPHPLKPTKLLSNLAACPAWTVHASSSAS